MTQASSIRPAAQGQPPDPVGGLLARALACAPRFSASANATLEALDDLNRRLKSERLQLAVLGQFKRGKSTLLNAMLGTEVLPMGVLPVTSIPTFLEAGGPSLSERYASGQVRENTFDDLEPLKERLTRLVTEEANPNNVLGLSQVAVRLSSGLLDSGVVLIDTPGVGSTLEHNTRAADAVLPACDAALFVVSPDPPITDVEIQYLARIRPNASRIVVVLNKIDLLPPDDAERAEAFLRRVLAEHAGMDQPCIFALSARAALAAKLAGDAEALQQSGLAALERHLADFIAKERRAALRVAVARKGRALVAELVFQGDLQLQSLRLPLADLERRRQVFERAIIGFDAERRTVGDLLTADQKRALQVLDGEAEQLRSKIGAELEAAIDRAVAEGSDVASAWRALQSGLPVRFEAELNTAIEAIQERLEPIFQRHQASANRLLDLVRETAAEIMELAIQPARGGRGFEAKALPYWVVERPDALNPLPRGAFDAVLPRIFRDRHARRRAGREIADIARRNVEHLRWSMRQNVQDAFRRFGSEIDERFVASLAATRGIMDTAFDQRSRYAAETENEIRELESTLAKLRDIEGGLSAPPEGCDPVSGQSPRETGWAQMTETEGPFGATSIGAPEGVFSRRREHD